MLIIQWIRHVLIIVGLTIYNSLADEENLDTQKGEDHARILPEYDLEEISHHKTKDAGIWVTYGDGVYDITEFIEGHPGGSKILLAAGGSIEPFWDLYTIHQTEEVREILDEMRIGTISKASLERIRETMEATKNDPYKMEPTRHPAMVINSKKPFDAETPPEILTDHFYTPNELFMVRNHLPVPKLDANNYKLKISVQGEEPIELTMEDLRTKFRRYTIAAAIQCAGNRRDGMNTHRKIYGAGSGFTAISNATWTGVRLCDVLSYVGLKEEQTAAAHVEFLGWDTDISGEPYGASIPLEKATDPRGDVLLAFEMNGQELPQDHGYPVRAIVAGFVGARNVKWLRRITVGNDESKLFWQKKDYKSSPPSVHWDEFSFEDAPAINEWPVQSAICFPPTGASLNVEDEQVTVKGYAYSGGGRSILRVDVSADGGQTWKTANLQQEKQLPFRAWAWTLWETELSLPKGSMEIVCKAVDSSHNVQPESVSGIWNLRGFLNNSWHRVKVHVIDAGEGAPGDSK